jgi:Uma2 family endonuclease
MTAPIDPKNMSCEEFQALLPELIGTGNDINLHPHIQSCELCRALLADLETIAEAARQLFPIEEPPDKLWSQIEMAIKDEEGSLSFEAPPGEKPDPEDPGKDPK